MGTPRKECIGGWWGGKPYEAGCSDSSDSRRGSGWRISSPRMPWPEGRSPICARSSSLIPTGRNWASFLSSPITPRAPYSASTRTTAASTMPRRTWRRSSSRPTDMTASSSPFNRSRVPLTSSIRTWSSSRSSPSRNRGTPLPWADRPSALMSDLRPTAAGERRLLHGSPGRTGLPVQRRLPGLRCAGVMNAARAAAEASPTPGRPTGSVSSSDCRAGTCRAAIASTADPATEAGRKMFALVSIPPAGPVPRPAGPRAGRGRARSARAGSRPARRRRRADWRRSRQRRGRGGVAGRRRQGVAGHNEGGCGHLMRSPVAQLPGVRGREGGAERAESAATAWSARTSWATPMVVLTTTTRTMTTASGWSPIEMVSSAAPSSTMISGSRS